MNLKGFYLLLSYLKRWAKMARPHDVSLQIRERMTICPSTRHSPKTRSDESNCNLQDSAQYFFWLLGGQKNILYPSELDISDIYASPTFKIRKESTHSYDVVNLKQLNPELGKIWGTYRRIKELHNGMASGCSSKPHVLWRLKSDAYLCMRFRDANKLEIQKLVCKGVIWGLENFIKRFPIVSVGKSRSTRK